MRYMFIVFAAVLGLSAGCDSDTSSNGNSGTGNSSNSFATETVVFGIRILATEGTPDNKVLHAGRVLAQYLDNDEDGIADNQLVVDELVERGAALVMFVDQNEAESFNFNSLPTNVQASQDLYGSETNPDFDPSLNNSFFDASLEEVLHLITSAGYANAYPNVFGESNGTEIAIAMDVARGGNFQQVPAQYPEGAWYTYDDQTCDYSCQATEYLYWALTSLLGAQDYPGRLEEIQQEWTLNTAQKVKDTDLNVLNILTDETYLLPTTLPDATYNGFEITLQEITN